MAQSVDAEQLQSLLESSWQKVLEQWDRPIVHDSFISLCFEQSSLGFAAGKYRGQLETPERNALAQAKIAAIVLLATQKLETGRTERRTGTPRWLLLVAVGLTACAVGWLLFVLSR